MKKQLLALFMAVGLFMSQSSQAQMTDGCIPPNFIANDINGNSWNLYDILNQGKSVFIDVSATWCSPCWSYHNTHALRDLYDNYGPSGTNELMVFFVEGDAATTLADLQGLTTATRGDWITGTTYPIIDNATIANQLQIAYFPTIYMICPDKTIKLVGQKTTAQLYAERNNCYSATTANDVGIANSSVCLNGNLASCTGVDVHYRLTNYGTTPLTSATVDLTVGGTSQQTLNWTGILQTYESTVLTFNGVTGAVGTNSAVVTASMPNGNTDGVPANNARSTSFTIYSPIGGPAVNESYAATTFPPAGWLVVNGGGTPTWTRSSTAGYNGAGCAKMDFYNSSSGDIDVMQVPNMDLTGQSAASLTFDLSHARYVSSSGSQTNDNMKIKISTNCGATWTTVYNKTGAALATTASQSTAFTPTTASQWRNEVVNMTPYAGMSNVFVRFEALSNYGNNLYVDNVNLTFPTSTGNITKPVAFSLYPNPAGETASIDVNLSSKSDVSVEVFDKMGKLVYSFLDAGLSAGEHTFDINTVNFAKGMYMVTVKTNEGSTMKKLIVE